MSIPVAELLWLRRKEQARLRLSKEQALDIGRGLSSNRLSRQWMRPIPGRRGVPRQPNIEGAGRGLELRARNESHGQRDVPSTQVDVAEGLTEVLAAQVIDAVTWCHLESRGNQRDGFTLSTS